MTKAELIDMLAEVPDEAPVFLREAPHQYRRLTEANIAVCTNGDVIIGTVQDEDATSH